MGGLASAGQGAVYGPGPRAEVPPCGSLCVRRVRCLSSRITPVGQERCAQTVGDGLWPHRGARGSSHDNLVGLTEEESDVEAA